MRAFRPPLVTRRNAPANKSPISVLATPEAYLPSRTRHGPQSVANQATANKAGGQLAAIWNLQNISILPTSTNVPQHWLEVGPPNDMYEREADRTADLVINMPAPISIQGGESAPVRLESSA